MPCERAPVWDLWFNYRESRPHVTTVTLSFDLSDPESALAFRQCISAEGLADGLLAYHDWAHSLTEGAGSGEKADPWFAERIHARYLAARGRRAFFRTKQALPLEEA